MEHINIDFSKKTHKPKPLHGVNNGPLCNATVRDLSNSYKEMHIPSIRLHDTDGATSRFYVDISRIFPDFSANENDPENYYFTRTDNLIKKIVSLPSEVFYRLGESIDHDIDARYAAPPKDFNKWSRIAVNIIRHYNDGWANGFHYNIKHWEIWNEGEGINERGIRCNWRDGTVEQLFELYKTASLAIKEYDSSLLVGGMAFCNYNEFSHAFIPYCKKEKLPLDFISYHGYGTQYKDIISPAEKFRGILDENGFYDTKIIYDEWNYIGFEHPWEGDIWKLIRDADRPKLCKEAHLNQKNEVGASYVAAVFIAMDCSPIDAAYYYDGQCVSNWCGIFDSYAVRQKPFYVFRAYGKMYAESDSMINVETPEAPYCMASISNNVKYIMISNYRGEEKPFCIDMKNLGNGTKKCEIFITDKERNDELDRIEYYTSDTVTQILNLKKYSVAFIRITVQ